MKKKKYFFLLMFYAGNAYCGRNCSYQTSGARAKTITGPWERYADNPIMYRDGCFRCLGHGTLVTSPDNRYFYLYYAMINVYLGKPGSLCVKTQFGQFCRFGWIQQDEFQAIGQVISLNELPQWDRPAMVGIHAKGKGIFTNLSLLWDNNP